MKKLKLHGFNNLTKSLSFCIYDICYANTEAERDGYIAYIDEQYNANRLTEILTETCSIIGANVLNIARQDYEPQGASVTILVSEEPIDPIAPEYGPAEGGSQVGGGDDEDAGQHAHGVPGPRASR